MTLEELRTKLMNSTGIPVAYRSFEIDKPPSIPFIVYYVVQRDDERADDRVFVKNSAVNVELYFVKKDLSLENKLEAFFDEIGIVYNVYEEAIEEEKMMVRNYEFDLMED